MTSQVAESRYRVFRDYAPVVGRYLRRLVMMIILRVKIWQRLLTSWWRVRCQSPFSSQELQWLARRVALATPLQSRILQYLLLNSQSDAHILHQLWQLWDRTRSPNYQDILRRWHALPESPRFLALHALLFNDDDALQAIDPVYLVEQFWNDPMPHIRQRVRSILAAFERSDPERLLDVALRVDRVELIPPQRTFLELLIAHPRVSPQFLNRFYQHLPRSLQILTDLLCDQPERVRLHSPPVDLLPLLSDPDPKVSLCAWRLVEKRRRSDPDDWLWVKLKTNTLSVEQISPLYLERLLKLMLCDDVEIQKNILNLIEQLENTPQINERLYHFFIEHPNKALGTLLSRGKRVPHSAEFVLLHYLLESNTPQIVRMLHRNPELFHRLKVTLHGHDIEELIPPRSYLLFLWLGMRMEEIPASRVAEALRARERDPFYCRMMIALLPQLPLCQIIEILRDWPQEVVWAPEEHRRFFTDQILLPFQQWLRIPSQSQIAANVIGQHAGSTLAQEGIEWDKQAESERIPIIFRIADATPFYSFSLQEFFTHLPLLKKVIAGLLTHPTTSTQAPLVKTTILLQWLRSLSLYLYGETSFESTPQQHHDRKNDADSLLR